MNFRRTILIFSILLTSLNFAQFNEEHFVQRVNSIYHSLEKNGLQNFSADLNSDHFAEITGGLKQDPPYYPLQFIWAAPARMFFIKKAPPEDLTEQQQKTVGKLQQELQPELRGILLDWQRFMAGNLLDKKIENYQFDVAGDTVYIKLNDVSDVDTTVVKYTFGQNGICLKISSNELAKKRKTVTYPAFRLIEGKWLCTGWDVQIENSGEISGGFRVLINSKKINEMWFPWDLRLIVQTKEKLNHTFVRNYSFRNIQLNRKIQIVD